MSIKRRVAKLEEKRRPTSEELAIVDVRDMTPEERRAAVGARRARLPAGQTLIVIDR